MAYTIEYVDNYLDNELDKLGSDYFPLPIKLYQFRKATYDFIRENTGFSEATQEISDDIKSLVRFQNRVLTQEYYPRENIFRCPYPLDYHRLITLMPLYEVEAPFSGSGITLDNEDPNERGTFDNTKFKRLTIAKLGQLEVHLRNPHNEPTEEYPLVLRKDDYMEIHFQKGVSTNYTRARILYYKEPTFGDEENLQDIIVDLPKLSVEKIIDRTANSLRFIAGDVHAESNYRFDQTFGKRRG